MVSTNPKVDQYLAVGCMRCPLGDTPDCKVNDWREELTELRRITLDCGLTEELKWGVPCYMAQGGNILLLSAFKDYCSLSFFKGALLKDTQGILIQPTENTQATRQLRFTSVQEITELEPVVKTYINEAVEIEKAGLKVEFKAVSEFDVPDEFQRRLDEDPVLSAAFEALTPGRQRGYLLYFSAPKQSKTRESRIDKCEPKILNGEGLHDR